MTAVEWLAQQLYERMNMSGDGQVFDELLDEAKELEKQQIIDAYESGYSEALTYRDGELITSEIYYTQTYQK